MMVRWLAALLAAACCAVCAGRAAAEEAYAPGMVRLHVLANSDSAEDQAEKMRVVSAVRDAAASLTRDCADADAAYASLRDGARMIEEAVYAAGYAGKARVETGIYDFPEKRYGDQMVPAGRYRAVRVLLGEGAGHNWWCVLYPDMCVVDTAYAEAIRQGEPFTFYSALARWARAFFGGEAVA